MVGGHQSKEATGFLTQHVVILGDTRRDDPGAPLRKVLPVSSLAGDGIALRVLYWGGPCPWWLLCSSCIYL